MLFNNLSQFAVLALLLVVGWLFGFASHSGGRRWRAAYDEERTGFAGYRADAAEQLKRTDAQIAALEQAKADLERRNATLASELEQARTERAALSTPAPARVAAAVPAASAARPAFAPVRAPGEATGLQDRTDPLADDAPTRPRTID